MENKISFDPKDIKNSVNIFHKCEKGILRDYPSLLCSLCRSPKSEKDHFVRFDDYWLLDSRLSLTEDHAANLKAELERMRGETRKLIIESIESLDCLCGCSCTCPDSDCPICGDPLEGKHRAFYQFECPTCKAQRVTADLRNYLEENPK